MVSVAFVGPADPHLLPTAGDDATVARWVPYDTIAADPSGLAFDHARILQDAIARMLQDDIGGGRS